MYALGETLTPRYKLLDKLGEGTFGRVLECWDRDARAHVAIKIIRSVRKYREAAMMEIKVLRAIDEEWRKQPPASVNRCVELRGWFMYRDHVCMVFEKLGLSLYDFMRRNRYKPFPLPLVRWLGKQLLEGLCFLHNSNLIHTDLKPENILLVDSECTQHAGLVASVAAAASVAGASAAATSASSPARIKLIDFGSAIFSNDHHSSVVSTRHYRAPEVILGLGWSFPCDAWSVGCILVELLQGEALFQTHEDLEHLAMMEVILDAIPSKMVKNADRKATRYFRRRRVSPTGSGNGGSGEGSRCSSATAIGARAPAPAVELADMGSSLPLPAPHAQPRKVQPETVHFELNWPEGARNEESIAAVSRVKPLALSLSLGQVAAGAGIDGGAADAASRRRGGSAGDDDGESNGSGAGAGSAPETAAPALTPELEAMLELVYGLLKYDPHERLTAEEALLHLEAMEKAQKPE